MKERKQFTKEFKEGAVRLVTEQGRAIADSAKRLGISTWAMSRWVKAEKREGADAFRGHGRRTCSTASKCSITRAGFIRRMTTSRRRSTKRSTGRG